MATNSAPQAPGQNVLSRSPRSQVNGSMSSEPIPTAHLRTDQAASYCGCSASHLEKLRVSGGGPAYLKPSPRFVVYDTADLDAWLQAGRRQSTSDSGVEK